MRGNKPSSRATVELRPSAATSTRASNVSLGVAISQLSRLVCGGVSALTVTPSRTIAPISAARIMSS